MDYSQFMIMHHELGLLVVFLLVFLFDTFFSKNVQSKLSVTACVLFGIYALNVCHIANRDVDKEHIECRYVHRAFAINQVE